MPEGIGYASDDDAQALPLPAGTSLAFWRSEVDNADRVARSHYSEWDENLQWYSGKSPDAAAMMGSNTDFVNVNIDFSMVQQKIASLFYETPELQLTGTGGLQDQASIVSAHKHLLSAILGDTHMHVLDTVHKVIQDCLAISGTGPVIIGYAPTLREVPPPPQLGEAFGLRQPIKVPIAEKFYAERFSPKKLLIPADFHSTDWDKSPWLGMRFRMPLTVAKREFKLPDAFMGTTERDEYVLDDTAHSQESTDMQYAEGQIIWYRAAFYEGGPVHPEQYRELVLVNGLDDVARHRESPHQTIGPQGRMTPNSLIGNPIHPLTIRNVPDSAYVPSDTRMTRPLVRELCKFRTQMVQEREANRSRIVYDSAAFTPETIAQIEEGSLGSLIGLEPGKLSAGIHSIMAEITKSSAGRQTYTANDYIDRDIQRTLAIGPNQQGQNDPSEGSATQTAIVDRSAQARQSHEQRQVLRWYLRLVDKVSSLVCRYLAAPGMTVPFIGPQMAQAWEQWPKESLDSRLSFNARPDSQIRLDAAAERKFSLDIYNFMANDPNVNRVELLKNLSIKAGLDPDKVVVEQLPGQKPKANVGFTFKGEDLVGPQGPIVLEIIQQTGLEITPEAIEASKEDVASQIVLGLRGGEGQPLKPSGAHEGPANKIRPLSQKQGDQSGERSGPKV